MLWDICSRIPLLKSCSRRKAVSKARCISEHQNQRIVINDYINISKDESSAFSVLSAREREVLQMVAEGKSTKEMAGQLNVSVKTVETHRKQIMDKLDLHSVAELTKYAIREGLTQLN